jgi:hypothetical protein
VAIHLGVLTALWRFAMPELQILHRAAVGVMVVLCVAAHLVEIAVFASAIHVTASKVEDAVHDDPAWAQFESFYHSAVTYTSLGGTTPVSAPLRLLTAVEALTGLILITWTASFLFLVMQRSWEKDKARR